MVSFLGFGSSSDSSSSSLSTRSPSPDLAKPHAGAKEVNPLNPEGLKPCCACPQTKERRDECFLNNSPEQAGDRCREFVAAHKACMRGYGFKV